MKVDFSLGFENKRKINFGQVKFWSCVSAHEKRSLFS